MNTSASGYPLAVYYDTWLCYNKKLTIAVYKKSIHLLIIAVFIDK